MFRQIQWLAVPGKSTENNTGSAEQVFQIFWQSKKKTEIKPRFGPVRLNQFSTCLYLTSPPILALYATPTPQIPLLATAATSPAHRVPCLQRRKKEEVGLRKLFILVSVIPFITEHLLYTHRQVVYISNSGWLWGNVLLPAEVALQTVVKQTHADSFLAFIHLNTSDSHSS